MNGERRAVIMEWFMQEVGGMAMLWCKRVVKEMTDNQDQNGGSDIQINLMKYITKCGL